jgi:hypothetical protein
MTIAHGEESPLVFRVQNISSRTIGDDSSQRRAVELTMQVDETQGGVGAAQVEFMQYGHTFRSGREGVHQTVKRLASNAFLSLPTMVSFSDKSLRSYSKVHLRASLNLDPIDPSKRGAVKCVQQQTFEIQLAESYEFVPGSDFLLVTNQQTAAEEIESWQSLAERLGLKMSVWNASLYDGVSLFQQHETADFSGSLIRDFTGKTVVFLNHPFENHAHQTQNVLQLLPSCELFYSARDHGIKTYVIGEQVNPHDQLVPFWNDVGGVQVIDFRGSYFFKSSVTREEFMKKIEKVKKKIIEQDPRLGHIFVDTFDGMVEKKGVISSKYYLGSVQIFPAPKVNEASLINVGLKDQVVHQVAFVESDTNIYSLLKMLPFTRKLEAMMTVDRICFNTLLQAIFSDLADELFIFSQSPWSSGWSESKLKDGLTNLNAFINYNWQLEENVKQPLFEMTIKFRAFLSKIPKARDYLWFYRRRRILSNLVKKILDNFLGGRLEKDKRSIKTAYLQQKASIKSSSLEELWSAWRNPKRIYTNFLQNNWATPIAMSSDLFMNVQESFHGSTVKIGKNKYRSDEERISVLRALEQQLGQV